MPSIDKKKRFCLHDIFVNTPAAANLIREGKTFQLTTVMQTGRAEGMQVLDKVLFEHVTRGEIDGSVRERTRQMHQDLCVFEPDAVLTDNIWGYLWGKLAYGAMLFATALTTDSMTVNFADPRRFVVFDQLAR